ncbi:LamG domain-containing protein [Pseudoxanthomonas sp.]|uniref:LamG domain-containing protein n=1 Tax=Pseudoxanthomonas sp. TaxID=1871049 RepID=UPI0035AF1554
MMPGIVASRPVPSGGGGDPHWSNVVALLHFDGANGSQSFVDEKGHTFSNVGGAELSTAVSKFGSASLVLNGSSDAVESPTSTDWEFGDGDFTIEAQIYLAAPVSSRMEIIDRWNGTGFGMQIMDNGLLRAFCQGTAHGLAVCGPGSTEVTDGEFHHVAFCRNGDVLGIFLDGVAEATAAFTGSIDAIGDTLDIGYDNNGISRFFNGYIDEVRITKGVARYTPGVNFTPPTAAFPDS